MATVDQQIIYGEYDQVYSASSDVEALRRVHQTPCTRKVRGEVSFGLLDYRQDMNDYRRRTLHLTPAGLRVVNKVVTVLGGN